MRVLFLPGYRYPASLEEPLTCGDLRYSFNLSRALARRGEMVTVLSRRAPADPEVQELDGVRVERYRPELGRVFSTSFDISVARLRRFRRLVRDADLLIANSPLSLELLADIPCPFVYVCSGIEDIRNYGASGRERAQAVGLRLLRDPARRRTWERADRVNTTARKEEGTLRRMGVPADRITTIGPGAELQRFGPRSGAEVEALRRKLDPAGSTWPIVLSVSRFTPAKGIPATLRAFATMRGEGVEALLVLVGVRHSHRAGQLEEIRRAISELGLEECVVIRENVPERLLPLYYSAADVTSVFSTGYDPLPTVMIESMSCGTPVISTAFETRTQVITHGENGLFVPEGDENAWVEAVRRVLGDRELARRLAEAGLERVRQRFDMDAVAESYVQLVEGL